MTTRIRILGIAFTATMMVLAARPTSAATIIGVPKRIDIPTINVHASVESLGVSKRGVMLTPTTPKRVSWYNGSPRPGKVGNAIMYGHLDTIGFQPAIFTNLKRLAVGETVKVTDDRQLVHEFIVARTTVYTNANVPLKTIMGATKHRNLNLYTCTGKWNSKLGRYTSWLVIYTRYVRSYPLKS